MCVVDAALTPRVVALRGKRRTRLAGRDPSSLSRHSLRPGFLTSAAEAGASVFKSVDTLRGYVRRADLFNEHAGAAFL